MMCGKCQTSTRYRNSSIVCVCVILTSISMREISGVMHGVELDYLILIII